MTAEGLLEGKRVLVVGGGGDGIGWAISREVARSRPAAVAVMDLRADLADPVAAMFADAGVDSWLFVAGDVRRVDDLDRAVEDTVDQFGGIDVLITAVGGTSAFVGWQSIDRTSDDDWDLVFEINLRYVFRVVRLVLRRFLEQGTGGTITSVGSIAGEISSPMAAPYGAAKAGLTNFARSVSAEYGRRGVRMNVVHPGLIATPAVTPLLTTDASGSIPAGHPGTPEDIARMVVFVASPAAAYLAGQSITVDGGASVRFPLSMPGTNRSMGG